MIRRYGLRSGVVVEHRTPSATDLIAGGQRVRLDPIGPAAAPVARALSAADHTMADLATASALAPDDITAVLHRLDRLGLIRHALLDTGVDAIGVDGTGVDRRAPVLSLDPMTSRPFGSACRTHRPGRVVLSRFAFARAYRGRWVLESPLSHYRATLHGAAAAGLLPSLARGVDLAPDAPGEPDAVLRDCAELLVHAGLAVAGDETGDDPSDRELAGWSFHDLLFHSRSRPGMHDQPIGRTYPLRGRSAPLPAVPPQRGERQRLDPAHRAGRADPPFTAVLDRRRSVRVHGTEPITVAALGEFLHRCARVRRIIPADQAAGIPYESSERPYPSGGGAYDLEIYVVANRCTGLAPGVYHYAAGAHALDRVAPPGRSTHALLAEACRGAALRGEPHLLLVLTARFARLTWKYGGMAYAMTLKNVGVLYQTMYLVATAMKLAPCALGTGSPAPLTRVLDLPYAEESSVGEFLLGVE